MHEEDVYRSLDHRNLSIVAGEGLKGGGSLEKSFGFRLAIDELEVETPASPRSWFVFFNSEDGGHYRVELAELAAAILRASGLSEEVQALRREIEDLRQKVGLLGIFERLDRLERKENGDASRIR